MSTRARLPASQVAHIGSAFPSCVSCTEELLRWGTLVTEAAIKYQRVLPSSLPKSMPVVTQLSARLQEAWPWA